MRIIHFAIALAIAAPAAAQTAAPADAHLHHDTSGKSGHEQHDQPDDCCADGKMVCCEQARDKGKAPACCEKHARKDAKADAHTGHHNR